MANFFRTLFTILFPAIMLLSSCGGNSGANIPNDVIPEVKMREVLVDVLIAEANITDKGLMNAEMQPEMQKMYLQIFDKHKITKEEFFRSMEFYTSHPDILDRNFQPIIDSLSTLEAKAGQL
ncbi:MAG: DUF4296 domain-containing protein [Bacteroidia bacterium]